jgi:hypothetical protein
MKKFMFSAIAMIAFSAVSMASNHIETSAKESTKIILDDFLKTEMILKVNAVALVSNHETCYNRRVDAYNDNIRSRGNNESAAQAGFQAYFRCMRDMPISLL